MKPIDFPESNVIIAKDQPEYRPLPSNYANDDYGTVTFCWRLTWRERLRLLVTGKLWHQVLTFKKPLQPQLPSAKKPEMSHASASQQ